MRTHPFREYLRRDLPSVQVHLVRHQRYNNDLLSLLAEFLDPGLGPVE